MPNYLFKHSQRVTISLKTGLPGSILYSYNLIFDNMNYLPLISTKLHYLIYLIYTDEFVATGIMKLSNQQDICKNHKFVFILGHSYNGQDTSRMPILIHIESVLTFANQRHTFKHTFSRVGPGDAATWQGLIMSHTTYS